jgi:hypothetical protein
VVLCASGGLLALGAGRLPAFEQPREIVGRNIGELCQFGNVNDLLGGDEYVAEFALDVVELLNQGSPALGKFADLLCCGGPPHAPGGVGLLDAALDLLGRCHPGFSFSVDALRRV